MLKKFICGLMLGSCLLLGADSVLNMVGTWKLNEAKSKFAKGQEEKDYTIVVSAADKITTVSIKGMGGFYGPDKPMAFKFTVPVGGGPITYIENPPPPELDLHDVVKDIDDRTTEITSTMHGKPLSTERIVISPDHKTMVIKTSGVDQKTGQSFKNVEVYDRQ
jgi:hypothetical protein